MGKLQVNGDISATGTMSASSFLGNASTSSIPLGFSYRETSWTWGTLTAANGYTLLTDWITPAAGGLAFADKGTQVSCQIDGYFYQDEGRYIVLDANNYTSYAPTKTGSGASGTWKINITGNAATASLLSIHNTVTNTSTRSVSASSWTGSVSGLKYVWGEAFKDTSLGSDTGDLVLGLRAGQYTSGGTELCMMIDGDYYSMGNKVLHAGNYNSYAPTKTGTGASGTWGINVTGSAGSVAWGNVTGKPSLMPGTPGSIELFPGSSAGHGGFIDFHYNNSSSDYTARLINWNGKLQVDGATFNVGGKVELWTDGEGGNIRITSPNGSLWSIDALENSKLRFIWAEAQVPFSFQHDGVFNCAAIATSAWGPSLPGSGYWGQVFFKT